MTTYAPATEPAPFNLPDNTIMVNVSPHSSFKLFITLDAFMQATTTHGVLFEQNYDNGKYRDSFVDQLGTKMPAMALTTAGALKAQIVTERLTK